MSSHLWADGELGKTPFYARARVVGWFVVTEASNPPIIIITAGEKCSLQTESARGGGGLDAARCWTVRAEEGERREIDTAERIRDGEEDAWTGKGGRG